MIALCQVYEKIWSSKNGQACSGYVEKSTAAVQRAVRLKPNTLDVRFSLVVCMQMDRLRIPASRYRCFSLLHTIIGGFAFRQGT